MDGLDAFARQFAAELFEKIPELREHARSDNGTLLVELTPGSNRPDCVFWVGTDADEITVGFGMFHRHFDWPARDSDGSDDDPIAFIQSLMSEEILIEDWTRSGTWTGSTTLARDKSPDLSGLEPDHVVFVRSWSGNLDRKISGR